MHRIQSTGKNPPEPPPQYFPTIGLLTDQTELSATHSKQQSGFKECDRLRDNKKADAAGVQLCH